MRLHEQVIEGGDDVFAARQRARHVAAAAGFDEADQVRIATALSELGRDVLGSPHRASATFDIDVAGNELVLVVDGFTQEAIDTGAGIGAARRLMSRVEVRVGNGGAAQVVTSRSLPRRMSPAGAALVAERLASQTLASPLDELRAQNRELLAALEEISARQAELVQLNAELAETNRGVMAMYSQLSDELDTTNRGVVALYAELDDKTQQLQAVTEAKTRFLQSISHELRSPVVSVLSLTRLLAELTPAAQGDWQRQVHLINRSADELLQLVNQLLDLAKAEAGHLVPNVGPVDVSRVAADVVESLRPAAHDGVAVLLDVPRDPAVLDTDEQLLRQIVRNLVANALSFTTSGSVITTVHRSGTWWEVEVIDSGIGIAAEDLDRVFEEFFQVRGALQSKRRGTGLGLAYSRSVAELLGGSLTAVSEPGAGSTFTVRLPASPSLSDPTTPTREPVVLHRVLVVDDEDVVRARLVDLLRPFAGEVLEASDGAAALDLLAAHTVDLVLLDLVMPALGGAEVLTAMAADPRLDRIPVVIVTSMDVAGELVGPLAHAAAVLTKDRLTPATLRAVVSAASAGGE